MLFALNPVDYGVLGLYLAVMLSVGAYFSREQRTSKDFFLAGRSMGWFPVGLSVMATLLSALSYSGVPGEAYYAGLKFLLYPAAVWLTLPILWWGILPLYHNLRLYSVYEYLEWRFDIATRFVSSFVFVLWRLLWLGGVLYAPCKVLIVAAGLAIPEWILIVILGLVSTLYTFLGGMKAVIWTDVIQSIVMAGGLVLIIGGVWWKLDGGPARVWEVAQAAGRTQVVDAEFSWTEKWSVWGILPHVVLAMLSFYIADQITVQRYLTAKSLAAARRSFVLNCISVSVMMPGLLYIGVALLAFYHDHPQQMRPIWTVNVDGKSRKSVTYEDLDSLSGEGRSESAGASARRRALLDWDDLNDHPSESEVRELVRQRRILKPNSKQPFESVDELFVAGADGPVELDINKLAMRAPPPDSGQLRRGEIILNRKAQDELMPRFVTDQLPWGVAGLILAALFAASMSSMDSGLNSICTLLIMDFHRRLGWGRRWLAAARNKEVEQLDEADELRLGRPLVVVIGVVATLFSLLIAKIGNIFEIMIAVVNTFGGPLLAVFLLGVFTRRCTARAAVLSLLSGTLFTTWIMTVNKYRSLNSLWPFEQKLDGVWSLAFGVAFTLMVGYGLSLFVGRRKTDAELRGLVFGVGSLGVRKKSETKRFQLETPDPSREHES